MSRKIKLKQELSSYSDYQLKELARQEEDLEKAFIAQLIIEERATMTFDTTTPSYKSKSVSSGSGSSFFTGCLAGSSIVLIIAIAVIIAIFGVIISFLDTILGIFVS